MQNLFTSNGRIPRSTFWAIVACFYGACFLIGLITEMTTLPEVVRVILTLMVFPVLIVMILAQIRRWHDRNKSGWWIFINLIPLIGGIWALIECGFLKGTEGPNQFGEDPLQR